MKHRVFEPFFTTKNEGMGMGLNICRTIIESHAGRLWVEDNKPRGTVFRFTLPVNREGAADAEGTKEAENAGDTGRAG